METLLHRFILRNIAAPHQRVTLMTPDSQQFLNILNDANVEYVVIGGVAMVAHGSARATFDLHLCYRRSEENIERLCRMREPLHARLREVRRRSFHLSLM